MAGANDDVLGLVQTGGDRITGCEACRARYESAPMCFHGGLLLYSPWSRYEAATGAAWSAPSAAFFSPTATALFVGLRREVRRWTMSGQLVQASGGALGRGHALASGLEDLAE